jgi:hypothetical protein
MTGPFRRWLVASGLMLALVPTGCLNFLNHVPDPSPEAKQISEQLPQPSREGVYVFLVNGNDPLGCANLYGIREFLHKLGYVKSYYGEWFHEWWLVDEIRDLHQEKPDAHIIVIGYELGADTALAVANAGIVCGANVDLLLYLEPRGFSFDNVPPELHNVIVVRKDKSYPKDSEVKGAQSVALACGCRWLVPTHPSTLEIVETEISRLAMSVPVPTLPSEAFPEIMDDPAPTPRPVAERKPAPLDEWDFLKLVSRRREMKNNEPTSTEPPQGEKKAE